MYLERAGLGQLPSVLFALPILFLIVLFRKTLGIMGRVKNIHWHGSDGVLLPVLVLFFIKFLSCLFSSLARCWNLASYDFSWFTTITTIFRKIETKSGTKLVRGKIPLRSLYVALFILLGVICMQATAAGHITMTQFISGFTCRISRFLISVR